MRLDVEKARKAGGDVLAAGDALRSDQTPAASRAAAAGLEGLDLADALLAVADGHEGFLRRFADGHDWLGHAVVDGANKIEATDDDEKASIEQAPL